MTAEQGAQFATPKPGTTPITNDRPCPCKECAPGPGIRYPGWSARLRPAHESETSSETIARILGRRGAGPPAQRGVQEQLPAKRHH